MLGSFVLSSGYYDAYYLKALRTKALIKQAFDKAFEKYDVILGPAAPYDSAEAGRILERSAENVSGRYLYDFRKPCRTSGNDAFHAERISKGLPIGLQLIGDCFEEKNIIRAGYAL